MIITLVLIIVLIFLGFGIIYFFLAKNKADEFYQKYKKKEEKEAEMNLKKDDCFSMMGEARKDFAASNLSSQLDILESLLNTFENPSKSEKKYVIESLKRVEGGLKNLRSFLNN